MRPCLSKVMLLKQCPNWSDIDKFMFREYGSDWMDLKNGGMS